MIKRWCGDLNGKHVVDFGCGGGLLAVPLLDMGASVTGLDISTPSIAQAENAAKGRGRFLVQDIRNSSLKSESADIVLMADVLDHIAEYHLVLREAARVLRPGGKVIIGTINRTRIAWLMAIILGEGLGLIPKGTHDYKLFIRPDELIAQAAKAGLQAERSQGEFPNLTATVRRWAISFRSVRTLSLAYLMMFKKDAPLSAPGGRSHLA
jgi:2-polyprenyl-6-hydroxyphenyl methylase/3-demethylubiquinone-9 3-methyltransferase